MFEEEARIALVLIVLTTLPALRIRLEKFMFRSPVVHVWTMLCWLIGFAVYMYTSSFSHMNTWLVPVNSFFSCTRPSQQLLWYISCSGHLAAMQLHMNMKCLSLTKAITWLFCASISLSLGSIISTMNSPVLFFLRTVCCVNTSIMLWRCYYQKAMCQDPSAHTVVSLVSDMIWATALGSQCITSIIWCATAFELSSTNHGPELAFTVCIVTVIMACVFVAQQQNHSLIDDAFLGTIVGGLGIMNTNYLMADRCEAPLLNSCTLLLWSLIACFNFLVLNFITRKATSTLTYLGWWTFYIRLQDQLQ